MVAQFLFISKRLATREYNCSAHSPQNWSRLYGETQYVLGVWSICVGISAAVLYTPAIRYFSRLNRFTSIRIMRMLAVNDLVGIVCVGTLFGIQMLEGAVFCSHRQFVLAAGLGAYACWNISSCLCVFLIINRILELTGRERLFQGARCTFIMAGVVIYGISAVLFIPPVLTNSVHQCMHFCPYIPSVKCSNYVSYSHFIHNSTICVLIPCLFIFFCVRVKSQSSNINKSSNLKTMLAKVFTQATIICIVDAVGSFSWILKNIIPTPQFITTLSTIGSQLIYASPCIIYIVMNAKVRNEFKVMIGMKKTSNKPKKVVTSNCVSIAALPLRIHNSTLDG